MAGEDRKTKARFARKTRTAEKVFVNGATMRVHVSREMLGGAERKE